jgi:hypothetical protein
MPAFYIDTLGRHATIPTSEIVGKLSIAYSFLHHDQKQDLTQSWQTTADIIKEFFLSNRGNIEGLERWSILYEYPIPRREKRIDAVLLSDRIVYVVEFKVGQNKYSPIDIRQVEEYCFDLRDFHLESRDRVIVPILFATKGSAVNELLDLDDNVKNIQRANNVNLGGILLEAEAKFGQFAAPLAAEIWNDSAYMPTPTIIEAAQTLYASKSVAAISRNQAGVENLGRTTTAILEAIRDAQENGSKVICFITGVPGAGKTLAGLNVVHSQDFQTDDKELGIFLSGNSPLVKVL